MADAYLKPEDINETDAQKMLAALNGLSGAAALESLIKSHGEMDIGPTLAGNIIARRDELGGFTDLRQLDGVALIGPARFNEIMEALYKLIAPAAAQESQSGLDELRAQIEELRRTVERLTPAVMAGGYRITLINDTGLWLGRPVRIAATVRDSLGDPVPGVKVTFVATSGFLRPQAHAWQNTPSISVTSGVNGRAEAWLVPAFAEEISPAQQYALESMLDFLTPCAAAPSQTAEGLQTLVRQYRWDINHSFRQVVDIMCKSLNKSFSTVNYTGGDIWRYLDATVCAFAHETTAVAASAVTTVRMTDWLDAWMLAYQELLETEGGLHAEFAALTLKDSDADTIMDLVSGKVQDFVWSEPGIMGEMAGNRAAHTAVQGFMNTRLAEMPFSASSTLFNKLGAASTTLSRIGATSLLAATTQTGLKAADISAQIASAKDSILNAVDSRIGIQLSGKLDTADFLSFQGETRTALNSKVENTEFQSYQSSTKAALNAKVDLNTFTQFQATTNASLNAKVDNSLFTEFQKNTNESLAAKTGIAEFADFQSTIATALNNKADSSELQIQTDLITGIKASLTDVQKTMVSETAFSEFQAQTATALQAKANVSTLNTLSSSVKSLQTKVNRLG